MTQVDRRLSRRARAALLCAAVDEQGDPTLIEKIRPRLEIMDRLLEIGRERRYAMGMQMTLNNKTLSFVRREHTDWEPTQTEAVREQHNKKARALIAAALRGESLPINLVAAARSNEEARKAYDGMRETAQKKMEAIVKRLPVWPWVNGVCGIGPQNLASILAHTGTFDGYANVAKVWARLGFAPHEGCAMSTYKRPNWRPRALTAQEWVDHPFSGERYAHCYVAAKDLFRAQWIGARHFEDGQGRPKPGHKYGEAYAARRARTALKHPDWNKAHSHKDALRVMFKLFLADLWEAWMDTAFNFDLGQTRREAQIAVAEIDSAAADHRIVETHTPSVGGGSSSDEIDLGQVQRETQIAVAEIDAAAARRRAAAAADHPRPETHSTGVSGGSSSRRPVAAKVEVAKALLIEMLGGGPSTFEVIAPAAKVRGLDHKALYEAKKLLRIKGKHETDGRWVWAMPMAAE